MVVLAGCYAKLKSSRLPCKYKLRFPRKTRSAGFDKAQLEARRSELNTYFNEFADWHKQVFDESTRKGAPIDLLAGNKACDPSRIVKKFFDDAGDSSANLTETVYGNVPVVTRN